MARRRVRRTSIFSGMVLEIATLLGILVVAQPTWSRFLVEAISARPRSAQATAAEPKPVDRVMAVQSPVARPDASAVNHVAQLPEYDSPRPAAQGWRVSPVLDERSRFAHQAPIASSNSHSAFAPRAASYSSEVYK